MKKIIFCAIAALCLMACNQYEPLQSFPVKGEEYQFYSRSMDEIRTYTLERILDVDVEYYDMYFRADDTVEFIHSKWYYIKNPELEGKAMPKYTDEQSWKAPYKQNEGKVTINLSPELSIYSYWKDSIQYNGIFLERIVRTIANFN